MPVPARCPLGHKPVRLVESVSTRHLISAYRSFYHVDIATMLGGLDEIAFCRCDECGLSFFDPPTPGPEALYAELARLPWYYSSGKEEYRLAARRIQAGQSVLEVGCGVGRFTHYLTEANYVELNLTLKPSRPQSAWGWMFAASASRNLRAARRIALMWCALSRCLSMSSIHRAS